MGQDEFPTKGNLIRTQHTLALARQGYVLLDQKRNVLIREAATLQTQLQELQAKMDKKIKAATAALIHANIEIGSSQVAELAKVIPPDNSIQIHTRSIMGVDIPVARYDDTPVEKLQYNLADTTLSFDEAFRHFSEVKALIITLATVENTVYRLTANIRKTQKRANALQHIIIPRYEALLKLIQDALEERERDGFVRLKVGKR